MSLKAITKYTHISTTGMAKEENFTNMNFHQHESQCNNWGKAGTHTLSTHVTDHDDGILAMKGKTISQVRQLKVLSRVKVRSAMFLHWTTRPP